MIGIYLLKQSDKVVYVGQSLNVYTRIKAHEKDKFFNSFEVIKCNKENLNSTEAFFILKFKPELNKEQYLLKTPKEKKDKKYAPYKHLLKNTSSINIDELLKDSNNYKDNEFKLLIYYIINIKNLFYDEKVLDELGWSSGKLKRTKNSLKEKGDLLIVKSSFNTYDYYIGKKAIEDYKLNKKEK